MVEVFHPKFFVFSPSTDMKVAHSLPATTSLQAVEEVTAVVEVSLVAMGAAAATNPHPNMEEVTTTRLQATTPPLHRATASRASMAKVEVNMGPYQLLTFRVSVCWNSNRKRSSSESSTEL